MGIDPKTITPEDCVQMPFPPEAMKTAPRPQGFTVVVRRSTLETIKNLGRASMNAEVGGMLVGRLAWDDGAFLIVEASIEGKYTDDQVASVTFTADTWDYVHEEMERHYPTEKIVGWYHTHPGFGIFLSHMDLFIHENFFSAPWQVAYVFDPQSEDEGFFVWHEGKLQKLVPCVIEDVPPEQISPPARKMKHRITAESLPSANAPMEVKSDDSRSLMILTVFTSILLLCCLGGIGFLAWQSIHENKALEKRVESLEKSLESPPQVKFTFSCQKCGQEHNANMSLPVLHTKTAQPSKRR